MNQKKINILSNKNKSNGFTSKSLIRRASSSFKHNASFVARLPTIRRHKSQSLHSPSNQLKPAGGSQRGRNCPRTMNEINNSSENLGMWSINGWINFLCTLTVLLTSHSERITLFNLHVNIQFDSLITDVTNNGKPMNASLSEDSVAETALAKKNSDGE